MGIVLYSVVGIWFLCTLFQTCTAIYRWYYTPVILENEKLKRLYVMFHFTLVMCMGACPLVMKFFDFKIHFFIGLVFVQNILSLDMLPTIF